jgi:hypothetical protein
MNIDPLSTSNQLYRAQIGNRENEQQPPPVQKRQDDYDRLSTELSSKVRASLKAMPEIRPEVVERGRQLLADPGYPSQDIVRKIAGLITPLPED